MTNNGLMTLLQQVLSEASEVVVRENGDLEGLDDVNRKAFLAFQALSLAETKRRSYRSIQAAIVVKMMRESREDGPIWLAHPPTDEYPRGFGSLKEFLTATGIGRSTVHDLNVLGMVIVPYCDEHNIPIEQYITEQKYPLLVEASTQLKRAVQEEDADHSVQEILDDVEMAKGRDAIRAKYRTHRDRIGRASIHYLEDDRAIALILLPSMDDAGDIVSKLAGIVSWDELVATVKTYPRSIKVAIDDPK